MPDFVKMYCEAGDHYYNRPITRGRKPKNCPDHRPEPPKTKRPAGYALAKAREAKAAKAAARAAESEQVAADFIVWCGREKAALQRAQANRDDPVLLREWKQLWHEMPRASDG
jgi:hypothetical protein